MLQKAKSPRGDSSVNIIGAGIAGTWHALLFARAGYDVTLHERDDAAMTQATSHWAGGMLAPWCEREASEPVITRLGIRSLDLWREQVPDTPFNGSLVVAHPRDRTDFERFARLTTDYERLDAPGIASVEPSLDGRFEALLFAGEGHVEPRAVLPKLHAKLPKPVRPSIPQRPQAGGYRGRHCDRLPWLERTGQISGCGVRANSHHRDAGGKAVAPGAVAASRWPLYIIPRDGNRFMIGATSIESEDTGVAFTRARTADSGLCGASGIRRGAHSRIRRGPAPPSRTTCRVIDAKRISVNGLYRHGFLLAPALAELTLAYVERGAIDNEVMQWS